MAGRKIDIRQAPAWAEKLVGEVREAATRGLLSAAHRTVSHVQNEVIPREDPQPVDRGIYRAGWQVRQEKDAAVVENLVPWADLIEWGVRAKNIVIGRAMIDAIAEWVLRKGLVSRAVAGQSAEQAARATAWAIAMNMKKRGIFNRSPGGKGGLRVMEKAAKEIPRFIEQECRREIEKVRG